MRRIVNILPQNLQSAWQILSYDS